MKLYPCLRALLAGFAATGILIVVIAGRPTKQAERAEGAERALSYACGYISGFDQAAKKTLGDLYPTRPPIGPECEEERDRASRFEFTLPQKEMSRWQPLPQN